jgi:hypothetical protein
LEKQLVIIGIIAILVTVELSGCLSNYVEFKLKNNCNSEIQANLVLSGAAITYTYSDDGKLLGNFSKTIDVYIDAGAEKSVNINNPRIDFIEEYNTSAVWMLFMTSDTGHFYTSTIQSETFAKSHSILKQGGTFIFHQDSTITQEG